MFRKQVTTKWVGIHVHLTWLSHARAVTNPPNTQAAPEKIKSDRGQPSSRLLLPLGECTMDVLGMEMIMALAQAHLKSKTQDFTLN